MLQVKRFQFFSHWWRCSMMAGMATWGSSSNPIQIDTLPLDTDSVWWVDGDGDCETQEQHVVADPYSEPSPEPLENVLPDAQPIDDALLPDAQPIDDTVFPDTHVYPEGTLGFADAPPAEDTQGLRTLCRHAPPPSEASWMAAIRTRDHECLQKTDRVASSSAKTPEQAPGPIPSEADSSSGSVSSSSVAAQPTPDPCGYPESGPRPPSVTILASTQQAEDYLRESLRESSVHSQQTCAELALLDPLFIINRIIGYNYWAILSFNILNLNSQPRFASCATTSGLPSIFKTFNFKSVIIMMFFCAQELEGIYEVIRWLQTFRSHAFLRCDRIIP